MERAEHRIERLSRGDADRMAELNALFADVFDDASSYGAAPPDGDYLDEMLGQDHIIVLVAIRADRIVGGLVAYELPKLEQKRSEIYIYDLAVSAAHRRRGIAAALIREVQLIARNCGAWVIYVQADYGDEPAIALYSKLGVREAVMHFDIPVIQIAGKRSER